MSGTQRTAFIQVDHVIDEREVERRIVRLAQERGVAVLTALPFGRGRVLVRRSLTAVLPARTLPPGRSASTDASG